MNVRSSSLQSSAIVPAGYLAGPLLLVATLLVTTALAPTGAAAQVRPGGQGFGGRAAPAFDEGLAFHVLRRTTYGPTEETLAEIRSLGVDEFLWRQLHPESIDDTPVESQLAAQVYPRTDDRYLWGQFYHEHLVRAVHSHRQLQEVMLQFWENHFDTVVPRGNNEVQQRTWVRMELAENDAFRAGAFGRFRDLLEVSAKSQAMMYFLDNYRNNVASGNENYARELLELHSLGVDCGYDQRDVEEVARIWTGWTGIDLVANPADPLLVKEGDFVFNPRAHDYGAKDTLGAQFPPGGGLEEGERVLDIVSRHPCTARFIGRKLLEVFLTDTPSEPLVDQVASVFLDTDGDVRQVLWSIFNSREFRDPAHFGGKVRRPLEFTAAAVRGVAGRVQMGPGPWDPVETWIIVALQGMPLFDMAIPTGYAEVAPPWITANGFLQRWKFADTLMNAWYPSDTRPTSSDPMSIVTGNALTGAGEVVDHFTRLLIGRRVDDIRRAALVDLLTAGSGNFNPATPGQEARLREMVAHVLGYPEFNKQ